VWHNDNNHDIPANPGPFPVFVSRGQWEPPLAERQAGDLAAFSGGLSWRGTVALIRAARRNLIVLCKLAV